MRFGHSGHCVHVYDRKACRRASAGPPRWRRPPAGAGSGLSRRRPASGTASARRAGAGRPPGRSRPRRAWPGAGSPLHVEQAAGRRARRASRSTSPTSATFEASRSRWNIDSPGEQPADRHAVQPAGQPAVAPRLDRVRPAELVQPEVRRADVVVDPAVRPARVGARVDHLLEGGVDPDLEVAGSERRSDRETRSPSSGSTPRRTGQNQHIGSPRPASTGIGKSPRR